jgi:hypothetical protein
MSSWNGMSRTGAAEDEARPAEPRKNCIGIGKVIVLSVGGGLAAPGAAVACPTKLAQLVGWTGREFCRESQLT